MAVPVKPPVCSGAPPGPEPRMVTVPDFLAAKARGTRLTMLTAYDYTMARLLDNAGVDGILVGDSLGMVIQGHPNSLPVTLDEIIYQPGGRNPTKLTTEVLASIGLGYWTAYRALGQLEKAGAIKVERRPGRCPVVSPLWRS